MSYEPGFGDLRREAMSLFEDGISLKEWRSKIFSFAGENPLGVWQAALTLWDDKEVTGSSSDLWRKA